MSEAKVDSIAVDVKENIAKVESYLDKSGLNWWYKNILFDFDGVILDGIPIREYGFNNLKLKKTLYNI